MQQPLGRIPHPDDKVDDGRALVLQGDRDEVVTLEHSQAVVAALPEARLAVLPGTHTLPIEHADLVNALIVSFLRDTDPTPDWNAFTG